MKKRKHPKELQTQNESTHYDINDVQFQQFGYQKSQYVNDFNKKQTNQQSFIPKQPDDKQKTCAQSLKQKLQYFWVHMINYLQFDRVLSKQEIDLLKKQNYTIKMKYPDNYYLTYQQRSKTFDISVEEITRLKMQEQQIKNKNFWNELKRFVCCQGGNELQENDEMLTAASQTEYFYLNKMKKKHKKSIEMTEQALIDKPFQKMTWQENFNQQKVFDKSNPMKAKDNIFQEDDQIFQGKTKDLGKQTNTKNNKHIDMNNIKTIKKKTQQQNQSNPNKRQENNQNNFPKQNYNQKGNEDKTLKDTQKVYIQKRQNLNSNRQQLDKLNINSKENEDDIDEVFIDKKGKKSVGQIKNKDLTGRKDNLKQDKPKISENQASGTNNQQPKKAKDQSSTNPSSLNPSSQKFAPHTENLENHHFNFEENSQKQNQKGNFSHLNNSDMTSISQSQNKDISDNPIMKKNHKRQRSKLVKQEPFKDLVVIQNDVDNQNQNQNNVQQQSIEDDLGKKKHYHSSQQISKKSKKKPFNLNQFDQTINEGLEDEENKLQKSFNMEFGSDADTIRNNNSAIQLAKKKKVRNKKMFNLQAENEKADQVIIFDQNEQNEQDNQKNSYAHTIDVSQNLTEHGVSSTSNIKKRKKAKRLKDLNEQKDDYNVIVIQGDQNAQQQIDENDQNDKNKNKFSTIDLQSLQNPFGTLKVDKKRKKKTRLREEIQKQEQFEVVDLGQIN